MILYILVLVGIISALIPTAKALITVCPAEVTAICANLIKDSVKFIGVDATTWGIIALIGWFIIFLIVIGLIIWGITRMNRGTRTEV